VDFNLLEIATCFAKTANPYWLVLKSKNAILPRSRPDSNNELAEKVAQMEAETGSPVPKNQQQNLKQEIIHRYFLKRLPRTV